RRGCRRQSCRSPRRPVPTLRRRRSGGTDTVPPLVGTCPVSLDRMWRKRWAKPADMPSAPDTVRGIGRGRKKTAVRGRASRTAVGGESENREALQQAVRLALAVCGLCCFYNVFYITESALVNRKI